MVTGKALVGYDIDKFLKEQIEQVEHDQLEDGSLSSSI